MRKNLKILLAPFLASSFSLSAAAASSHAHYFCSKDSVGSSTYKLRVSMIVVLEDGTVKTSSVILWDDLSSENCQKYATTFNAR
ncbi:MAG: hypothetical protein NT027_14815 [Proteobacteria bacterium]|nr:hypothetical protein [Pseudomonadota bacterium]